MTLFDTSVVIDARDTDSPFHEWAKQQIAKAVASDGAAVNTGRWIRLLQWQEKEQELRVAV